VGLRRVGVLVAGAGRLASIVIFFEQYLIRRGFGQIAAWHEVFRLGLWRQKLPTVYWVA